MLKKILGSFVEWKVYDQARVCTTVDGVLVLAQNDHDDPVPWQCPICGQFMSTFDDARAFDAFGCCHMCKIAYVECAREKWLSGWRPPREIIDRSISMRSARSIDLDVEDLIKNL